MKEAVNGQTTVAVVGAGFTGLSAAYQLAQAGCKVIVLERDDCVGGLAGSFDVGGEKLEKFYHHCFTSDDHIIQLVKELELEERIVFRLTKTGMYYKSNFYSLSSPLDVLKFRPLCLADRVRLGTLVLKARRQSDWRDLESLTAEQWLIKLAGKKVFDVVWKPLLTGKFGRYAPEVSAVYMWGKLRLRGGSRGKGSHESLAYFKGGFSGLADEIVSSIEKHGGRVFTRKQATDLLVEDGRIKGVVCGDGTDTVAADYVLLTPALPIVAKLVKKYVGDEYYENLLPIEYLSNVCLVLELEKSLSDIYWLNVNDPDFPYIGIIEHTNMEKPETYGNRHIIYLSRYLPMGSELYQMSNDEILQFSLPYMRRMFPSFEQDWILRFHVWKAAYAQPIVVCDYSRLIPDYRTPVKNLWLSTMAQVYPEDRGTNYAVREGRKVAQMILGR